MAIGDPPRQETSMWPFSDNGRLDRIAERLDRMEHLLDRIRRQQAHAFNIEQADQEFTMATLADIQDKVAQEGTVIDSAVALLGELAQLVRDNATDPAALQALADEIDSKTSELADAVATDTPATPEPPAEPGA